MTRENVTTVQLAVAAINDRDVDAYLACCVEDVELQTPLSPVEGAYRDARHRDRARERGRDGRIKNPEDRLFMPAQYVPLFKEKGWRTQAG